MNGNDEQVLSSWKEIAGFFGKGVRTVQRWERQLGLPVRRPRGAESQIVLARPSELRKWMNGREDVKEQANAGDDSGTTASAEDRTAQCA